MQENVSVLLATILAVVIIVLFPIYNIATRQDSMSNTVVVKLTTNFVDEVRYKGYLSSEDYEEFLTELGKTGNMYDIELEVYKPILIESNTEDGEVIYEEEYEITYTEDILKTLNGEERNDEIASNKMTLGENVYYMDQDYKFYVRIRNTNTTQAQVLLGRLFGGDTSERIVVNYGGIVYENEWENSEYATVVQSNIFISRPMDYYEEEYKYEYIATLYDPQTEQTNKMYGIAVRLSDSEEDTTSGIVKFKLTYKDIKPFKDEAGNILNGDENKAKREEHIKSKIDIEGSGSVPIRVNNIDVEEKVYQGVDGKYQAEYLITLKDIVYNYVTNPYIRAKVRVEAGSGESEAGTLGELTSKEFIIFYEVNLPKLLEFKETTGSINNGITLPVEDNIMEFYAKAQIVSNVSTIDKIVFELEKDGNHVQKQEIAVNSNTAEATTNFNNYEFIIKGNYKVTAYAIDTRDRMTEIKTIEFQVTDVVKGKQALQNRIYNEVIVSVPGEGWVIDSYRFWTEAPNHVGTDYLQITASVVGDDNYGHRRFPVAYSLLNSNKNYGYSYNSEYHYHWTDASTEGGVFIYLRDGYFMNIGTVSGVRNAYYHTGWEFIRSSYVIWEYRYDDVSREDVHVSVFYKNNVRNEQNLDIHNLDSIKFIYRLTPWHDPNPVGRTTLKLGDLTYYNQPQPFYIRSWSWDNAQLYNNDKDKRGYYLPQSQGEVDENGNHICAKDAYMHWEVKFKYVGT